MKLYVPNDESIESRQTLDVSRDGSLKLWNSGSKLPLPAFLTPCSEKSILAVWPTLQNQITRFGRSSRNRSRILQYDRNTSSTINLHVYEFFAAICTCLQSSSVGCSEEFECSEELGFLLKVPYFV